VRFLADMGVDVRVVDWLRGQGHDAVHLREEGLHRAPDEQVFAKALAEEWIVLTFDLDFGDLAPSRGTVPGGSFSSGSTTLAARM
jgi:predicted nuclease of predicted toxin-antitoxin system